MLKTSKQIFEESAESCLLVALVGNEAAEMSQMASFEKGKEGDLVCIPDAKALEIALEGGASIFVLEKKLAEVAIAKGSNAGLLVCANIGLAHAFIKQKYGDHDYTKSGWGRIHPRAIIHESVSIPESTIIGPNVIIEQGAKIGEQCHIMANVLIEHDAIIGNYVKIHPNTIIGWECEIGNHSLILSNTVIGGEGFGYSQDQYFNHHRIPQTGNVQIGEKVTIGANNTIDRGTYGATVIGNGCIFDNICHVAHNVKMGENCIILTGFMCAGSVTIGSRVVASGGTMIKDHVTICDDVWLMHRAGVVKNISTPGMYAGGPVLPMKNYVKSNAIYGRLGELRMEVMALKKKMNVE